MKNEIQKGKARCIVVLGSGRSGTSAVTRVLNILGVSIGNKLVPPKDDNPKGFWEHQEIVSINEKLLKDMNSYWDDIRPLPDRWWEGQGAEKYSRDIVEVLKNDFNDCMLWGIKDPRMSRLLRLWHPVFMEMDLQPNFIITFRNPLDVAESMYKVGKLSREKSLILWLLRTVESELETRGYPRVFVSYEKFLNDWRSTMAFISDAFEIRWPKSIDAVSDQIDQFVNPAPHPYSNRDKEFEVNKEIPDYLKNVYHCMKTNKNADNNDVYDVFTKAGECIQSELNAFMVKALIDDLGSRNQIHNQVQTNLGEQIAFKNAQIVAKDSELSICEERLKKIQDSTIWRVTKPVRIIYNKIYDKYYQ